MGAEHERQAFNRVKQQWLQYLGAVNQVDALLFQDRGEVGHDVRVDQRAEVQGAEPREHGAGQRDGAPHELRLVHRSSTDPDCRRGSVA